MADLAQTDLPRLVYVGDVPVESTVHGSALLYRLLERYPKDRLRIIEIGDKSASDKRLPDISYVQINLPLQRILYTRLNDLVSPVVALTAGIRRLSIERALGEFSPEAVLTVAHGYGWQLASTWAHDWALPLHVIAHDEWSSTFSAPRWLKKLLESRFQRCYRQASSRFCVSPYMAMRYEDRYKAAACLLYPSRAMSIESYATPSPRALNPGKPLTVGYAGTINGNGQVAALKTVRTVLEGLGGQLYVFGPANRERLRTFGLDGPNMCWKGLLSPAQLLRVCRAEVDVLIVATSFDQADRYDVEINFPSKLTDYTALGLPILIYGPPTSSAVRWARENEPVAAIADVEGEGQLREELIHLSTDHDLRLRLATRAIEVGARYFSYAAAEEIFLGRVADKKGS